MVQGVNRMRYRLKEWSFVFFDLGSKEAARRVRLLRGLRRVGAALRNQSVYCMPYSAGFAMTIAGQNWWTFYLNFNLVAETAPFVLRRIR